MAAPQVITLPTDFGTTDAYVSVVKGILLVRAPRPIGESSPLR